METTKHGMKAKTIKAIIHNKVNYWTDSITDVALRERVKRSVVVTGGAIASIVLRPAALESLLSKELRIKYPLCSLVDRIF